MGEFHDFFAATETDFEGQPIAQGTAENPHSLIWGQPDGDQPLVMASVDTTESYYVLNRPEDDYNELLYVHNVTKQIGFSLYKNSDFSGESFCSTENNEQAQEAFCCTVDDVNPICLKVDGSNSFIGSLFELEFTI